MLILSRKIGESIVINKDIFITILGINGNQIRLGIDAPKSIPIHREEIQLRIDNDVPFLLAGKQNATPLNANLAH